ncbi:immunoglobulin kappa light chain-like [Micropterus salmoides]|uniref:immunoglobulin kappa light chain-like n=1 Tax=Micropterus salmoides TaxID=27706 RepID=UPI0018EB174D|nr:immunoglobulin kappa light chain-like [Micropterus salmoides]
MTSPKFVFYLTCLFLVKKGELSLMTELKLSSSQHQESGILSFKTGDKLTLQCSYDNDVPGRFYWYKQALGQTPRLISSFNVFDTKATFHDEFENNPRFTLHTGNGEYHLIISHLHISDSATYYCVNSKSHKSIAETFVSVKASGLNVPVSVHQSASEPLQPGGSVTLNCTVHTETCDGEHSVYWFKNSEESHPGLIYTHGGRNDQCERKSNTQTHTCVYNLPLESLNLSHAGTYYCAVASCGHILFGNGTKLDFEDEVDSLASVYFLSGALAFTIVLLVLLAVLVYRMNKRNSFRSTEFKARFSALSTTEVESYREADNLHYAAISVNLPKRSRRQRNDTKSECVYSTVKK